MILGASSFLLNAYLVRELVRNLKKRQRLKTLEDRECPPFLEDLTLAVPVRNEGRNLKTFLSQLEEQASLPSKMLFLNDQSSDNTGQLLLNFRAKSLSQVDVIMGSEAPPFHNGKIWALKQLLEKVQTPFVLFVDADVRLSHPRALFSLYEELHGLRKGRYSFASLFPRSIAKADSALLVNQVFVHLYYFGTAARVTNSGQVMFVNAEKLRHYEFLDEIAFTRAGELKLASLFQQREGDVACLEGGALFSSAYYSSFSHAFKGFSRKYWDLDQSLATALGLSLLFFWAFVLPFILLPFAVLNPWWLGALFLILWGQYRLMQELNLDLSFVALTPIAASLSSIVHVWSALKSQLRIREEWHGRLLV